MSASKPRSERTIRPIHSGHWLSFIQLLWEIIRLPLLTLLVILEPLVVLLFGGLALSGVLTTLFFKAISLPHFPTLIMLFLSIGFGLALVVYEGAIRVLSD